MTLIAWSVIALAAASAVNLWLAMAERRNAGRYWKCGEEAADSAVGDVIEAERLHREARSIMRRAEARAATAERNLRLSRGLLADCEEFAALHDYGAHDEARQVLDLAVTRIKEGTR